MTSLISSSFDWESESFSPWQARSYRSDNNQPHTSRVTNYCPSLWWFSRWYCRWPVESRDSDHYWKTIFYCQLILKFIKITSLVTTMITPTRAFIIYNAVLRRSGSVFIENDPFMYYFIYDNFNILLVSALLPSDRWKKSVRSVIQSWRVSLPWCLTDVMVLFTSR